MKKLLLLMALAPLFHACKNKKAENAPVPLANKTTAVEKADEPQTYIGKWKMVAWNDPTTLLNQEDKQKVMDATEIEITNDGRFITRAGEKENTVNYSYYENTRTMMVPSGEGGKMESLKISFSGNQMILASDKGSIVLERLQ